MGALVTGSSTMKWITGVLELFLAIPILGGAIVIGLYWVPLGIMFILHLITLLLSIRNKEAAYGSVVGIITSLVAWIPFIGWMMHLITAILLIISAVVKSRN